MDSAWEREEGVTCVVCPACAFTFDACHTDEGGGYSCPVCAEIALREERGRLRDALEWLEGELPWGSAMKERARAALGSGLAAGKEHE